MHLYRAGGEWFSSQLEATRAARRLGTHWQKVEITPTVKGLLTFLNGRHLDAVSDSPRTAEILTASMADTAGIGLNDRALNAVRAFVSGRKEVTTAEIEAHLRDLHRIGAGPLWIGQMLRRLGWACRRNPQGGRVYRPAEPVLRDLASGAEGEGGIDLLTAAEGVLASPATANLLWLDPFVELVAAVKATRAEARQ